MTDIKTDRPRTRVAGSPFQRLAALLADHEPGLPPINATIGEPKHAVPDFVAPILNAHAADFNRYPPIRGIPAFREAVAAWADRLYGIGTALDPETMILPLNGSREGLYFTAITAATFKDYAEKKSNPAILLPNPFYHAYAAGAATLNAEAIYLSADADSNFLPDLDTLDPALLDRTLVFYYAAPANPQGATADRATWKKLITLARKHDFLIAADECYAELYRKEAPASILQAAEGDFSNILAFHSLSKRSNLAGLRCGFMAGDPDFIKHTTVFRNMAAPQVPIPVQHVAAAAYGDDAHVADNRRRYNEKFAIADRLLSGRYDYKRPDGGFFLWLNVAAHGGSVTAAQHLWQAVGLRVIPGAYLCETDSNGVNPGADFIRIAMVDEPAIIEEALTRLTTCLK